MRLQQVCCTFSILKSWNVWDLILSLLHYSLTLAQNRIIALHWLHCIIMKIFILPLRFFLVFTYFLLYPGFLSNSFFHQIADLIPFYYRHLIILNSSSLSLIKKDIYLVSPNHLAYPLIFGSIIQVFWKYILPYETLSDACVEIL